jgi:putative transposase
VQALNANAQAERWVRTARAERLDWLLIIGPRPPRAGLRVYAAHYNAHRPHRSLGLQAPDPAVEPALSSKDQPAQVHRRDLLSGLVHEYR